MATPKLIPKYINEIPSLRLSAGNRSIAKASSDGLTAPLKKCRCYKQGYNCIITYFKSTR